MESHMDKADKKDSEGGAHTLESEEKSRDVNSNLTNFVLKSFSEDPANFCYKVASPAELEEFEGNDAGAGNVSQEMLVPSLGERYRASMILAGVGDALGYHGGSWEFNKSGESILRDLMTLTDGKGLDALVLEGGKWRVSDDTVMHLATAEAIVEGDGTPGPVLYKRIAMKYKECFRDMRGRAPGGTCGLAVDKYKSDGTNWDRIPFNGHGGGCGAAMRAMCIGLRYPAAEQISSVVAVAVESGRMTHHHPTGYLGALAAAYFTWLAIQHVPTVKWGQLLLDTAIPLASKHIREQNRCVKENLHNMNYFREAWEKYLVLRRIRTPTEKDRPVFPSKWKYKERDEFYSSVSFFTEGHSFQGWGGSSGHDSTIIAYDALLWSGTSWKKLCYSSMLHGGDSDSTGTIAAAWWGAIYGFKSVPEGHHSQLEYRSRMQNLADLLLSYAPPSSNQ